MEYLDLLALRGIQLGGPGTHVLHDKDARVLRAFDVPEAPFRDPTRRGPKRFLRLAGSEHELQRSRIHPNFDHMTRVSFTMFITYID